jgi:hypothetical protein
MSSKDKGKITMAKYKARWDISDTSKRVIHVGGCCKSEPFWTPLEAWDAPQALENAKKRWPDLDISRCPHCSPDLDVNCPECREAVTIN